MSVTALIFPHPANGGLPAFVLRDPHVYSYADQNKVTHWVNGEFWYEYPDGKEPVFFRKDAYLYDYPTPGEARFVIREGKAG
jgi:hypothetical protein